jgi:hypothetical protein
MIIVYMIVYHSRKLIVSIFMFEKLEDNVKMDLCIHLQYDQMPVSIE